MSITAVVTNWIKFDGDVNLEYIFNSGDQIDSPSISNLVSLAVGDNTFQVPFLPGEFTVHGLAIIPPDGNIEEPFLKGNAADVGMPLNATRASLIQFSTNAPPATIVITSASDVMGFRLIWF